jgi:L-asparaginase/Glu-tRNA(Gln) amidotransferase subunit D
MTYSSAALSLMMGQGLQFSIVYTGSQKPIQEPLNDAADNVRNALYTLESLYDCNMAEVVVVIGDHAVLATAAEKIDGTQANAFGAPLHKYVARFDRLEYPVKIAQWLKPRRTQVFDPKIWDGNYSHTLVIKSYLGLNPAVVEEQARHKDIKAIILYSYGGNTADEAVIDIIMPIAKKRRLNVYVVSPVGAELKATYPSVHHMLSVGITPLYMTLSAALAKIELAIRLFPKSSKEAAKFMAENYVGEVPSESSRYIAEK